MNEQLEEAEAASPEAARHEDLNPLFAYYAQSFDLIRDLLGPGKDDDGGIDAN